VPPRTLPRTIPFSHLAPRILPDPEIEPVHLGEHPPALPIHKENKITSIQEPAYAVSQSLEFFPVIKTLQTKSTIIYRTNKTITKHHRIYIKWILSRQTFATTATVLKHVGSVPTSYSAVRISYARYLRHTV